MSTVSFDLDDFKTGRYNFPSFLRSMAARDEIREPVFFGPQRALALWLADQIEAQTKPPRIPEPGLWGVVEARTASGIRLTWVNDGSAWTPIGGMRRTPWPDLIDPTLIREGINA